MREILFRGKRLDNGEWVGGYHVKTLTGQAYILPESEYISFEHQTIAIGGFVEVDSSTEGQYTGLTDRNGVKIFEGDVCTVIREDGNAEIMWDKDSAQFTLEFNDVICNFDHFYGTECEVIGNIHDDPELLKGGGEG